MTLFKTLSKNNGTVQEISPAYPSTKQPSSVPQCRSIFLFPSYFRSTLYFHPQIYLGALSQRRDCPLPNQTSNLMTPQARQTTMPFYKTYCKQRQVEQPTSLHAWGLSSTPERLLSCRMQPGPWQDVSLLHLVGFLYLCEHA